MDHLSLKRTAYNLIKEKLLSGEYEPNSRLMESELAEQISMSRTPVREAINTLAAEGFVTIVPRKGVFCSLVTQEELADLLELRITLEVMAVQKCIQHRDPAALDRLRLNLVEFRQAMGEEDYRRCNALDSDFHRLIAEGSRNRRLIKVLSEIEDFIKIARVYEKKANPRKKNDLTIGDHEAIVASITEGNVEKAVLSMKDNINRMRKNLNV